jgi:hypothetical protein
MKQNKLLLFVFPAILFAVYNIFAFSLFDTANAKYWYTYAFTILALIFSTGIIGFCASKKNLTLHDIFLDWPLVYVSGAYMAVQFVLAFLIMSINALGATAANLIQIIPLAIFALLSVSSVFGRNIVDEVDTKQKHQMFFVKNLTADIESLARKAVTPEAKAKLGRLYEAARYSDPVSCDALSALENAIGVKVGELSSALVDGCDVSALCEEIMLMIADRNAKCESLK